MENITIALSNGTELTGLELNGNNYISKEALTEETFNDGLSPVAINGECMTRWHSFSASSTRMGAHGLF